MADYLGELKEQLQELEKKDSGTGKADTAHSVKPEQILELERLEERDALQEKLRSFEMKEI